MWNTTAVLAASTTVSASPARIARPQNARQNSRLPWASARSRSAAPRPPAISTAGPQTRARKASRPTSSPSAVSSTARAATEAGLESERPPEPARIGSVSFAPPTPNTNAEETACESDETTR